MNIMGFLFSTQLPREALGVCLPILSIFSATQVDMPGYQYQLRNVGDLSTVFRVMIVAVHFVITTLHKMHHGSRQQHLCFQLGPVTRISSVCPALNLNDLLDVLKRNCSPTHNNL